MNFGPEHLAQIAETHRSLAYPLIVLAAFLEGEIIFTAAAILVSRHLLDPVGVALSGAAGAAIGDQLYFYLLRGRLNRFVNRFPSLAKRGARLTRRVRQNETLTVLALRFSPGLRIALAAACAYAGVPRLKFSVLNGFACLVWATAILGLVAWLGPSVLARLGISGWWAVIIPGVIIVILFRWIGHEEKEDLENRP